MMTAPPYSYPILDLRGKRCPDTAHCHTAKLGAGGLVFCLSENRIFCDYTLPFGSKFFCTHPEFLDQVDPLLTDPSGKA